MTITGTGFTSASAVNFGSVAVPGFTVVSDSQITVTSPPGTNGSTVDVSVTAVQGTSPAGNGDKFTFNLVPVTVTSVNPNQGSPTGGFAPFSTSVTITGTGFVKVSAVTFGTLPAANFTVNSETQITATSPTAPKDNLTVDVTVTAGQGTSPLVAADMFTFSAKPILQFFVTPANSPASGGPTVRIAGVQLTGTTSVSFGNQVVTCPASCSVQGDTEVDVVTPPHPIGGVAVTVTNGDGTSLVGLPFAYTGIGTVSGTGTCETASSTCAEGGAVLLPTGKVLGVGPATAGFPQDLANLYDPATGVWTAGAGCACGIDAGHAAPVLLPSGKVLVLGENFALGLAVPTAFLYDPAKDSFTATAGLPAFVGSQTATLLQTGKVLITTDTNFSDGVAGGYGTATELYDPATGTFTRTGPMQHEHLNAPATLLASGKVLIEGDGGTGSQAPLSPFAETYDPSTGTWTAVAPLNQPRFGHTATLLLDGRVLVAGGQVNFSQQLVSAEIYDPVSNSWQVAPNMTFTRGGHDATLLANGTVLVVGGDEPFATISGNPSGNNPSVGEIFDPVAKTWTPTPPTVFLLQNQNFGGPHLVRTVLLPSGPAAACGARCGQALIIRGTDPGGQGELAIPAVPTDVLYAPAAATVVTPTGPAAGIGLAPSSLTFGPQAVGSTTATQTVTVTSSGRAALSVTTIALAGTNAGEFAKTTDTCTGATVAAGATCTVGITFTPTVAGAKTATLTFTDNATGSPHSVTLSGTTSGTAKLTRLAGAGRIDTAIATSQAAFPAAGSAKAVVLTRDDLFPDALAGVPLAAAKSGPLLLTATATLNPLTQAEITRALPAGGTVYLLGGKSALDPSLDTPLQALGFKTVRVSGTDRFSTAVAIAASLGDPAAVIEVSGVNFPDAVSAGPAAIVAHAAILLTNGSIEADPTAAYLAAHAGDKRTAIGGPAATADPGAFPVVGADRFATSALVAGFFPAPAAVGLATGLDFPDALSGGPFLGAKPGPILLVNPTGPLPPTVSAYLVAHARTITSLFVFGGTNAVSTDVTTQATTAATP